MALKRRARTTSYSTSHSVCGVLSFNSVDGFLKLLSPTRTVDTLLARNTGAPSTMTLKTVVVSNEAAPLGVYTSTPAWLVHSAELQRR
jgi:hypothetical protein